MHQDQLPSDADLVRQLLAEQLPHWALSTAIVALPYHEHTNAFMADQARRKLAAVLEA